MSIPNLIESYSNYFRCQPSQVYSQPCLTSISVPAISVCLFEKQHTGLPHDVLITAGMSLTSMSFPENFSGERWSSELIQYLDTVEKTDFQWLTWLAELPFFDSFVLGHGHSVTYHESLYPEHKSKLSKFLLLETTIVNDRNILASSPDTTFPCEILWVIPLTDAEYRLKIDSGFGKLLDKFDENKHPLILNKQRSCYVSGI